MASPQARDKLATEHKIVGVVSGDVSTAAALPISESHVAGTWFNMRDYSEILIYYLLAVRADNIEQAAIQAATDSSGSNAATIVSHSDPTGADAAGDAVVLQVSAEQLAQEGSDAGVEYTHISPYVKAGNSSDRIVCVIFGRSKRPVDGLTADYSS